MTRLFLFGASGHSSSVRALQGPPATDGWFHKTFAYGPLVVGGAQGAPSGCIPTLLHSSSGSSPDACAAALPAGQPFWCADGAFWPCHFLPHNSLKLI